MHQDRACCSVGTKASPAELARQTQPSAAKTIVKHNFCWWSLAMVQQTFLFDCKIAIHGVEEHWKQFGAVWQWSRKPIVYS